MMILIHCVVMYHIGQEILSYQWFQEGQNSLTGGALKNKLGPYQFNWKFETL